VNNDKPITIGDLYPEFSPEEQEEAQANRRACLAVVKRVYDGLKEEGRLEFFIFYFLCRSNAGQAPYISISMN
jgi:hypothetical protein